MDSPSRRFAPGAKRASDHSWPRNDKNPIVSQLQLGIIKFLNLLCDEIRAEAGLALSELFEQDRRVVTWHYQ
jgi:hypothetical protein